MMKPNGLRYILAASLATGMVSCGGKDGGDGGVGPGPNLGLTGTGTAEKMARVKPADFKSTATSPKDVSEVLSKASDRLGKNTEDFHVGRENGGGTRRSVRALVQTLPANDVRQVLADFSGISWSADHRDRGSFEQGGCGVFFTGINEQIGGAAEKLKEAVNVIGTELDKAAAQDTSGMLTKGQPGADEAFRYNIAVDRAKFENMQREADGTFGGTGEELSENANVSVTGAIAGGANPTQAVLELSGSAKISGSQERASMNLEAGAQFAAFADIGKAPELRIGGGAKLNASGTDGEQSAAQSFDLSWFVGLKGETPSAKPELNLEMQLLAISGPVGSAPGGQGVEKQDVDFRMTLSPTADNTVTVSGSARSESEKFGIDSFKIKMRGDSYGRCEIIEQQCQGSGCEQLTGAAAGGQRGESDDDDGSFGSPGGPIFPEGDTENPFRR